MKYLLIGIFSVIVLLLNLVTCALHYFAWIIWSFKIVSFRKFLSLRINWFSEDSYYSGRQNLVMNETFGQTFKRWLNLNYY